MKSFLIYLFWPNPGLWTYGDPKVMAITAGCIALVAGSFLLRMWRTRLQNQRTRSLSKSWPMAALWFGIVGIVLVVCRVELIQFMAMRALLILWFALLVFFIVVQMLIFRRRHYTVVAKSQIVDARDKYLPKKR